jgi:hypothetical protein
MLLLLLPLLLSPLACGGSNEIDCNQTTSHHKAKQGVSCSSCHNDNRCPGSTIQ